VRISASVARDHAHAHVVGVYDRDDELVATVAAFLADALREGGTAVIVATIAHRAALEAALNATGFATDELQSTGQYSSFDAANMLATFMSDGRPDRVAFEAALGSIVETAAARGAPVRLFGEMVDLLWEAGNIDGALELESHWNDLAQRHAFALFCGYALSSLEAAGDLVAAKQMCDHHSNILSLPDQSSVLSSTAGARHDTFSRVFVGAPAALREVRRFVRQVLVAWGAENRLVDAEIIASELATNAVKHAHSPFRVTLTRSARGMALSVRDASFEQPQPRPRHTGDGGGRGLALVAEISTAWGTSAETDGKTVWAALARIAPVG
jgi:anti-sigma regulatory factor (Ser/Thr protein kinase)